MVTPLLSLPADRRGDLKEPFGPIFTDPEALLAAADADADDGADSGADDGADSGADDGADADADDDAEASDHPLVAVGDVVTSHLLEAGSVPTVALVDEKTEREAVDDAILRTLHEAREATYEHVLEVENPAAAISEELLVALADAIDRAPETTMIAVDGEEDLAAVPALIALPSGAHLVYGQPGEGMVLVTVDDETRNRARTLLEAMDGDVDAALAALED